MFQYSFQVIVNIIFGTYLSYTSFFNLLNVSDKPVFNFLLFFFGLVFVAINTLNYYNTVYVWFMQKRSKPKKDDKDDNIIPPDNTVNP